MIRKEKENHGGGSGGGGVHLEAVFAQQPVYIPSL